MRWEELNPTLLDLFTALGKDRGVGPNAEHKDRPRRIVAQASKQTLTMQVTSVRGIDSSLVRTFDESTQKLTESVEANHVVTYRLVCDAITNTDRTWAWGTLQRIRTRIRRSRSIEALLALNASLLRCLPAVEANFIAENRVHNRVVMDVQLLVHVSDVDDTGALGWIQSVEVSSEFIKDADGTNLPTTLQMVDVLVDSAADPP